MQSSWDVTYIGPSTQIALKKIKRFLDREVSEEFTERVVIDGIKQERMVFRMQHADLDWPDFIQEMLALVRKLSPEWKLIISEPQEHISGHLDSRERDEVGGFLVEGPSGLAKIGWEIRKDQKYGEVKYLNGNKSQW